MHKYSLCKLLSDNVYLINTNTSKGCPKELFQRNTYAVQNEHPDIQDHLV